MSETPTLTSEAVKIPEDTSLTYAILAFNLLKKLGPKGLSLEKDVGLYRTLRYTGENIILKNVADKVNHSCDFAQDYFSIQIRKRMIDSLEDNAPDNAKGELERMEIAFKFKYVPIIINQAEQQASENMEAVLHHAASNEERRENLKDYLDQLINRPEDQIINLADLTGDDNHSVDAAIVAEPTIAGLVALNEIAQNLEGFNLNGPQVQKMIRDALKNLKEKFEEISKEYKIIKPTIKHLINLAQKSGSRSILEVSSGIFDDNTSEEFLLASKIRESRIRVINDANANVIIPALLNLSPQDLQMMRAYPPFLNALAAVTFNLPLDATDGEIDKAEKLFQNRALKLYSEIDERLGKQISILGPRFKHKIMGVYLAHDNIPAHFLGKYHQMTNATRAIATVERGVITSYELEQRLPKNLKGMLIEVDTLNKRFDLTAVDRLEQLAESISYIHREIFDAALGLDTHVVLDDRVSVLYQILSNRIRNNLFYSDLVDSNELVTLYNEFIAKLKQNSEVKADKLPKTLQDLIKRYRKKFSQFDAIINADGYYIPRPKKNKIPEREPRILPFPARHDPMAEKLLSTKIVQAKAEVPIDINQRVDLNNIIRLPEHLNTYEDKLNFYRTAQNVLAIIAILPYDLPINGSANHLKLDLQKLVKQIFQKLGQNQYGVNYNSPSQVFNDFDLVLSQWWKHNGSNLNIKHILDDDQVALYTEMIESGFNPTELQRKPGEEKLTENQILRYLNNRVVAFEYNGFTLTLPPGILARNIVNLPSYTDQIRVLHMFALPQASVDKSTTAANTWVPVNTSPVPPSDSEVNENTILVNPSPSPVAVPVALASSEHRSGSALLTAAAPLLLLQTIDSNRPMTEPREENQAVYEHAAVNLFFLHLAAQTGAIRWGDLTDLETKLLDNLHVDQNVHDMPYEKLFSMFTASPIGIGNFQPRLQFGLKHKLSKQAKIYLPDDKVKLNDPNYLIKLLKVALPNGLQVMIPGVDNTVAIMTDVLIDNFKNLKTYQKLIILGQIFNSLENQSSIYQI